jgi:signal recognition particle subunit SRP54
MRMVRTALLEADVNLRVVREFCDHVVERAVGAEVIKTLRPDELIVKIVHEELIKLMGPIDVRIPFVSTPPTIILMAGLQGSGKTTTCAKLARYCTGKGKRPLMVAADLKRPAAIDQLEVLGESLNCPVYAERGHQNAVKVCRNAVNQARKTDRDVVILDTAGRLAIDEELMGELSKVAQVTQPHQIYLVLDAMTGQDAVNTAKIFNETLELDGVILTKFDSDTRGGAALSVKKVTSKPIKFIGVGEKLDQLDEFHAERMASRILGMGDVVSLVEKAQQQYKADEAAKLEKKMAKGALTLDDFLGQLKKLKQMGSMKDILKMIPGAGSALKHVDVDDGELTRMEAIICSMTPREKSRPELIDASRRRRIARGSGTEPQDVSGIVKNFDQARNMMKAMSSMPMSQRMKMGSKFAEMSLSGQKVPQFKVGTAAQKRKLSKKDKRKRRKRR